MIEISEGTHPTHFLDSSGYACTLISGSEQVDGGRKRKYRAEAGGFSLKVKHKTYQTNPSVVRVAQATEILCKRTTYYLAKYDCCCGLLWTTFTDVFRLTHDEYTTVDVIRDPVLITGIEPAISFAPPLLKYLTDKKLAKAGFSYYGISDPIEQKRANEICQRATYPNDPLNFPATLPCNPNRQSLEP